MKEISIVGSVANLNIYSKNMLLDMNHNNSKEKVSASFIFEKSQNISSFELANLTGLNQNQICLAVESGLNDFQVNSQSLIAYSGDSHMRVKLAGVCAAKENFIDDFVKISAPLIYSTGFNFEDSGCNSVCLDNQTCCVLFLFKVVD